MDVRCPNCQTSFILGNGDSVSTANIKDGIVYLTPKTIRNENKGSARLNALKEAGIDVEKLQALMQSNSDISTIFADDDPILKQIGKGGFIKNNELFRRWITAQTFRLIRGKDGWTAAVRKRYKTDYVFKQTVQELELQVKLQRRGIKKDRRFLFFTLDDFISILKDLDRVSCCRHLDEYELNCLRGITSLKDLLDFVNKHRRTFIFSYRTTFLPPRWLNCFKGAGAYYTLQNIIRTHGLILPGCNSMQESLNTVESLYNEIVSYCPSQRRWDIMMSMLTTVIQKTGFELKF